MKKFIYNTFYFILIAFALILTSILLTNALVKGYAVLKVKNDMLVIGHSHPACAFDDSLISNFSNFASSGESYFYNYYKLIEILKKNKNVKTVFVEFSNNQIDEVMDDWTWGNTYLRHKYNIYAPFVDLEGKQFLYSKNPTGFISNLGISVKYNLYIIANRFNYNGKMGGYRRLDKDKTDVILANTKGSKQSSYKIKSVSYINLKYLKAIINKCKKENIQIYLVRCPMHVKCEWLNNEKTFQRILRADFPTVEFLDFKNFPLANSEFGDTQHLNFRGARKFSIFFNHLVNDEKLLLKPHKEEYVKNEIMKINQLYR